MVGEACAHVQGESLKAQAALLVRLLNSPVTRLGGRSYMVAARKRNLNQIKPKLIGFLLVSALLLNGCALATYNGWAVDGAKKSAIAAEADCTQKASNGTFGNGAQWAECYVSMGENFASAISLKRPDLLQTYEINIRQLGTNFDDHRLSGQQFRSNAKAAFDSFFYVIQKVEIDRQKQDVNGFVAGMGMAGLSAVQANGRSLQPIQQIRPTNSPVSQQPSQTPTALAPAAHSPFIDNPASLNCTSLLTGALIQTNCQRR